MASEFSIFYTTWPDSESASKASQILLQEKLVACTNLLPTMHSQYWWEGKIETATECVLILKTQTALKSKLQSRLESLHPYQVPCFLEIPIQSGNAAYLGWLKHSLS